MTSIATPSPADAAIADLSLEEAIDELANVEAYIERMSPQLAKAIKARADYRSQIAFRMQENGARKFERGGWRGWFEKKKQGSASVYEPTALRAQLEQIDDVPKAALNDALPWVTADPIVKPDLRKVRKLADWGSQAARLVAAHISEPLEFEVLVIEQVAPEMLDVTGTAAV